MRIDDPTKGEIASCEHQFSTYKECLKAADAFSANHSEANRYELKNGFSFGEEALENRFVYVKKPIFSPLIYYKAKVDGADIHTTDNLQELYLAYTAPGGGYTGVADAYHYNGGGSDEYGRLTGRCILANIKTGARIGLIINPPFPNGHPLFGHRKNKFLKKYLPVLLGFAVGLLIGPARKKLRKFLRKTKY